jgi:phosphoglycerate dehydrogenase-like enzyme
MMKIINPVILTVLYLYLVTLHAAGPDAATMAFIKELNIQEGSEAVRERPDWQKPASIVMSVPAADLQAKPELIDWIKEVTGDIPLITLALGFGQTPNAEIIGTMEVYLGYCTPAIVRRAVNLRWLQHYGVGVDMCTLQPEISDRNFIMTNNQHYSAPPIAEHVIAMMMMLTRGLAPLHTAQLEHDWARGLAAQVPMTEVKGRTMLIAGLGGIGTEVASRAHGLGMRIIATRNSSRSGPDYVDYVGLSDELLTLAAEADVIVNALPLTSATTALFDKAFFDVLKPGSYFISVGRGKSTVTTDLVAALNNGQLAGAGLDVTDPEPLPPGHELWDIPNVIITPHNSSTSDRALERRWIVIRENLRRYINGEKMLNVVDLKKGY